MEICLWLFFLLGDILLLTGSVKRINCLLSTWIGFTLMELLLELYVIVTTTIVIGIHPSTETLVSLCIIGLQMVFNIWAIATVYGAREEISISQSNPSDEMELRQL